MGFLDKLGNIIKSKVGHVLVAGDLNTMFTDKVQCLNDYESHIFHQRGKRKRGRTSDMILIKMNVVMQAYYTGLK